jgi:murein L,D-transpeptidase YafK
VYLLALFSKGAGNDVAVDSYPFKLEDKKLEAAQKSYDKTTLNFWVNLKTFYDYFEKKHIIPVIKVNKTGLYII